MGGMIGDRELKDLGLPQRQTRKKKLRATKKVVSKGANAGTTGDAPVGQTVTGDGRVVRVGAPARYAHEYADWQTADDARPQVHKPSKSDSKASTEAVTDSMASVSSKHLSEASIVAVKGAIAKPTMQDCVVCTESFEPGNFPRPEQCMQKPSMCGDCFERYLDTHTQVTSAMSIESIKCPCAHDECAVTITWEDVKRFAKKETFER